MKVLDGLSTQARIALALVAARMAFSYWQRAFPEKDKQAPLLSAIEAVDMFCTSGQLPPAAKATAELAYRTVSSCDLPPGDIQRASGFSVAHVAMAPWLLATGHESRAQHNAMVSINYAESVHSWAGHLQKFEAALISRAEELRLA